MSTPDAHYAAVADVQARYAISLDHGDAGTLRDCFTADAVLSVDGTAVATGAEAIVARLTGRAPAGIMHLSFPPTLGPGADPVPATSYFLLVDTNTGTTTGAGEYADEVRLDGNGRARFARRDVRYRWKAST